jgi:hypothetical protein
MINAQVLQRACYVGALLQFTMVIIGHYLPWVRVNVFEFGGMLISGTAGLLYARDAALGYGRGILGGALAGGVCGLIGIAVSVLLGDTPIAVLVFGTVVCIVTGAAGGLWGEIGARIRARFRR